MNSVDKLVSSSLIKIVLLSIQPTITKNTMNFEIGNAAFLLSYFIIPSKKIWPVSSAHEY